MEMYIPLVRVSETVGAAPGRVWNVLTHKTGVMFMGAEVMTDWGVGQPIIFKGEWKGKRYEDKGVVQTVEPQRKLAFTHFSAMAGKPDVPESYNLVTVDLDQVDHGTVVTLTQSVHRDADRPNASTVSEFEKNWRAMLSALRAEAERG